MVLNSMVDMMRHARENKYAVGYFESWNLESILSVTKAAEEEKSPVIIGFGGQMISALNHDSHLRYFAALGKVAAETTPVPAVLILNEASDFQQIMRGLRFGFTCVMLDCSHLPFEKNIEITRRIVEVAHVMGVAVEGQFDVMPEAKNGLYSGKINKRLLTDPERATRYVRETHIDSLAVSIGNVHGLHKAKAVLDFDRIESLKEAIDIPLVLHGATGVSDEDIKKAILMGICKINIGAALRLSFVNAMKEALDSKSPIGPEEILKFAEEKLKNVIRLKMQIYGSSGRAYRDELQDFLPHL